MCVVSWEHYSINSFAEPNKNISISTSSGCKQLIILLLPQIPSTRHPLVLPVQCGGFIFVKILCFDWSRLVNNWALIITSVACLGLFLSLNSLCNWVCTACSSGKFFDIYCLYIKIWYILFFTFLYFFYCCFFLLLPCLLTEIIYGFVIMRKDMS